MNGKHIHLKYKICVSGAAETGHCAPDALDKAKILGEEIVKHHGFSDVGGHWCERSGRI